MYRRTHRLDLTAPEPTTSADASPPPSPPRAHVLWLFETRGRGSPKHRTLHYYLVSAVGVVGFVGLLGLSTLWPLHADSLRAGALVWFAVFGALRIALWWRR